MKLFGRLLISHCIPPLILTLALALPLTALVRVGLVLATLNETELGRLGYEGELHRAAWSLDVEMRHALLSCARGEQVNDIRLAIARKTTALEARLRGVADVPATMLEVLHGYLDAGSDALVGDACETLHGTAMQMRRAQLDERLTNLWVERLAELRRAMVKKESAARQIVSNATWLGIPLAVLSFVLAMWLARRMARLLEEPLVSLAQAAQRVGRGDFATSAVVRGPPEVLALAEDLERMRCQLQQLEALKQGFLASVSHELRTPLSKIREALALLNDGALGELEARQLRVVQIARTACEREIRMVVTLLDLSRLRAGSPIRPRENTSIDNVLHAALEGERAEAQQRGVQLEIVAPDGPYFGCFDPPLIERAIANIVRNAVAVSARGQCVVVERAVTHESPDSPCVHITVSDHGPGVPAEIQESLFDAFVTRSVPHSAKSFGSGIGLALAREVARAHSGDLCLLERRSGAEHGTVFELTLPLEATRPVPALVPRSLGLDSTT
jgi:two-component system, NtrC family, sensor histidine kinase GlrK